MFNPFLKGFHLFMNNRDHRKITVIDGKVGFTGGYNLANEYFNITHPYGYWKDTGVKITGNADKKLVYAVTRSYYHSLVRNGVRIYEYTPGFCHCKMSVADDMLAACGTINLDYRSLYHHFENSCLHADCEAVKDTRRDFENTMAECEEVTETYKAPTAGQSFLMHLLRFIAPLL